MWHVENRFSENNVCTWQLCCDCGSYWNNWINYWTDSGNTGPSRPTGNPKHQQVPLYFEPHYLCCLLLSSMLSGQVDIDWKCFVSFATGSTWQAEKYFVLPYPTNSMMKTDFFYRAPKLANQLDSLLDIHTVQKTLKDRLTLVLLELLRTSLQWMGSLHVSFGNKTLWIAISASLYFYYSNFPTEATKTPEILQRNLCK